MSQGILPPIASLQTITERLPKIFPEGTASRGYLVRDVCAKTVFVMLYVGAVERSDRWLRPNQVTRMTNAQAGKVGDKERERWIADSLTAGKKQIRGRWYADNTREPIRDETIRNGLIPVGAVIERTGLATTSSKPRYTLAADFAELFSCDVADFIPKVEQWQRRHLTPGALARLHLLRQGVGRASDDAIYVRFPNGELRRMDPGPSSEISKAVIEEFASRFLANPGVIFLSESRSKVVARDDQLASGIGLQIPPDRLLPDIILVDLAPQVPLLVFVEVVATDGPVSESRKADLLKLATDAGYAPEHVAFVTALRDRGSGVFRKTASHIAWGSYVWFKSEPDCIIGYRGARNRILLSDLSRLERL